MFRRSSIFLIPILISTLVLNPLAATLAVADGKAPLTFAETVRNTKETDSILISDADLHGADADSPGLEDYYPSADSKVQAGIVAAFAAVAKSMEPKERELPPEACEPALLSRFQSELAAQGLPADKVGIRFAILSLRQKNLIDDITLMPLLATYPAWASIGYQEKEWTRTDAEGRTAIIDCPTDQYLQLVGSVKSQFGRKMKRKNIVQKIDVGSKEKNDAGQPRYLPVQTEWLRALESASYDLNTQFALNSILKQVTNSKDSSPRADPNDTPTKVMSKRKKKGKGLSNRLALYSRYNSFQINMLADEFKKFTERMDLMSADATIVIHYKDGRPDEVIPLSPQEQYRMAAKLLHKDVEEMKLSGLFAGKSPTFDEVVLASVETGFLHASELDAAMGVDDVWNPKVSGWSKVVTLVKKYGGTVLLLIPNPISFWAGLALTLAETLITKKTQGAGEPEDNGVSIF
jgi:hypothetical protein